MRRFRRHTALQGAAISSSAKGRPSPDLTRDATAFSLVELVIAMVVSAILVLGLGSALSIATRSVRPESSLSATLEAARAVQQLQNDLRFATRILSLDAQLVDVITTDSDVDGQADRVRYRWSGMPGDPLERRLNDGAWYPVCEAITELQFDPHFQSAPEKYVTPPTVGNIQLLDHYTSGSNTTSLVVDSSRSVSQFIHPDRFESVGPLTGSQQWLLTSVDVYSGCTTLFPSSWSNLQLSSSTQDGLPTQQYLHTEQFSPLLFVGGRWNSFAFTGLPWLGATDGVHLGFSFTSGWNALNIPHSTTAGDGFALRLGSSETEWQRPASQKSLLFRAYGRLRTLSHEETVSPRYRYQYANISLGSSSLSSGVLHAAVDFVNQPWNQQVLADTDFSSSPATGDADFDGTPDLSVMSSSEGGFGSASTSLSNGILQATATGYQLTNALSPGNNVDVRIRMRHAQAASGGPVLRVDSAESENAAHVSVMVALQRESDGTQTLNVYDETGTNQFTMLNSFRRLDGGFLDIRVLLDVEQRCGVLWVNGVLMESFRLTSLNSPGLPFNVQFQAMQSMAEFDDFQVVSRTP